MKKYKDYTILIIFTMGTQALIYFLIKNCINNYNNMNSIMNIPLVKPFIYFYNIWYPFILLITFIIYKCNKKEFKYLIASMLLGAIIAQITFLIYPTEIIRPTISVNNITDWLLNFTYKADTPSVNCLPSMHCIYCFITNYYIFKENKINYKAKTLITIFSLIIVLSTLFTKQHIIEDVILSLIYTIIVIIVIHFNKDNIDKLYNKIF